MSGKTDYEPTILRFATAFGISPRMRFDLTVSEFIRQLALGKELVVYDTNTWRPYCHVKDFARIIEMVLKSPPKIVSNQIFNAGADINNYTKQMIIDEIKNYIPNSKIKYVENGIDPRDYRVNFNKIKKCLRICTKIYYNRWY